MQPAPTPDLTIAKSHSGDFTIGSTGTYSFSVNNIGTGATTGTITVTDTLPTGLTVNGGVAGAITEGGTNSADWTCNSNALSPQTVTCTSSTAIAVVVQSVFNFTVNVGASTAVGTNSITNTATVSGGGQTNTANDSSSDPTTVVLPTFTCSNTMFSSSSSVAYSHHQYFNWCWNSSWQHCQLQVTRLPFSQAQVTSIITTAHRLPNCMFGMRPQGQTRLSEVV